MMRARFGRYFHPSEDAPTANGRVPFWEPAISWLIAE